MPRQYKCRTKTGVSGETALISSSVGTPFGELKFAPASDDPNPLPGWRPLRLLFQHAQSVRERGNAIPAKLQIVAEAAANNMHVGIIQAGNNAPTFEVDDFGFRPALIALGVVHADNATILDG